MPMGMTKRYESVVCISLSLLFLRIFLYRLARRDRNKFFLLSQAKWTASIVAIAVPDNPNTRNKKKNIYSRIEESVRRRRRLSIYLTLFHFFSQCVRYYFFETYDFFFESVNKTRTLT